MGGAHAFWMRPDLQTAVTAEISGRDGPRPDRSGKSFTNEGNRTSPSPLMLLLSVQLCINSCGPWSGAGGVGRGDFSRLVSFPFQRRLEHTSHPSSCLHFGGDPGGEGLQGERFEIKPSGWD